MDNSSFSAAICGIVFRGRRCSRPTLVRSTTRERSTFVASWRPHARLDDGDVHARGGERSQRGGRDRLELRRAAPFGIRPDPRERGSEVCWPPVEPVRSAHERT
jgi:hypothetical protein